MSNGGQFIDTYRQETEELLAEIEEAVLEIEQRPDDLEIINRLFRAMHTIKGSGAMFGFDEIAGFAHHLETALDKLRDGSKRVNKQIIDLILSSRDQIYALLEASMGGPPADATIRDGIVAELKVLMEGKTEQEDGVSQQDGDVTSKKGDTAAGKEATYRIRFLPPQEIVQMGSDPTDLFEELGRLGNCSLTAQTDAVPNLEEIFTDKCYLYWDITLSTTQGLDAIRDVFIFIESESQVDIEALEADTSDSSDSPLPRLGEILVEKGDADQETIEAALKGQKRIGEILVESGRVTKDKIRSALNEQKILDQRRTTAKASSVRVPSDKLDHLINLVGELVITQARLTQVASRVNDMEMAAPVEEVERLTTELRDVVLNIRMLPIGTTFSKYKRLVRDLSNELGKDINLITEGAETELDKTVIERLGDPLVHLIRNCIDHGIEAPEKRKNLGKPETGTILLIAAHKGANVVITIQDDGQGLDAEKIRAKAMEKGLIAAEAKLSEQETYGLVFAPGFSTAETITSVSGRGVGMDVVKREIDALGGSVQITSQIDQGTAIHLSLPLTLAIIDGLLVKVEDNFFVLPLSMIEECVEMTQAQARTTHGRNMVAVRGDLVPFIRLREFFKLDGVSPDIEHIAIVRAEELRVGIVVDHIIGDHQTVIKSLGKVYQDAEGVSGATIMGDGTVALILDIPELVRRANQEETEFIASGS